MYCHKGSVFVVSTSLDAQAVCSAIGGTSVEVPPGYRGIESGEISLAWSREPDGNKFCRLHWSEQ